MHVPCLYKLMRRRDESASEVERIKCEGNVPIHSKLLLIVGLYWAILWETLNNFNCTVELGVDKLV